MMGPDGSDTAMLLACHDCGTVHWVDERSDGAVSCCATCGHGLLRHGEGRVEQVLALNLAALVLFGVANFFPIMSMTLGGQTETATLIRGVVALYQNDMPVLSVLVFAVAIGIPFIRMLGTIFVLGNVLASRRNRLLAPVFRTVRKLRPWAMTEVYLLGLVVAWVKLRDLATIHLGLAILALAVLIVVTLWAEAKLEPQEIWERIAPQTRARQVDAAAGAGWMSCHGCGQLVPADAGLHACPRCHDRLHLRKPNSLARTWALLIAAAILYIPANLLPVMTVTSLGSGEPDTILSGVKAMIALGMWPVAILVFFASIVVPSLKLIGLSFLLISVQRHSVRRRRDRTVLYRLIEGIGRWSMVDIFMISILVALVNLGEIATIQPGQGAAAFASVVVLTMLASSSFDPRLIWDQQGSGHESDATARA
jgi:paraquat-inducible protein A